MTSWLVLRHNGMEWTLWLVHWCYAMSRDGIASPLRLSASEEPQQTINEAD